MKVREAISFLYGDAKSTLGEIIVDAFVSEQHSMSAKVTEHPIEGGGVISDHVALQPLCLSIEGLISNTPMHLIGLTAFDSGMRFIKGDSNDFCQLAFEKLEAIYAKREPISIATSLKTYRKMVLESLSVERGGRYLSETLHFTCAAKQLSLVAQKLIAIPQNAQAKRERVRPKKTLGTQDTKAVPAEKAQALQQETSLLLSGGQKAIESAKSLFGW